MTTDVYELTNDTDLVPLAAMPLYPATQTIALEFEFDTMDDGTNHAVFNGTTYNSPLVPSVMSELTLAQNASVAQAYGPLSFVLDHLQVFDIVIMNADSNMHPLYVRCVSPYCVVAQY